MSPFCWPYGVACSFVQSFEPTSRRAANSHSAYIQENYLRLFNYSIGKGTLFKLLASRLISLLSYVRWVKRNLTSSEELFELFRYKGMQLSSCIFLVLFTMISPLRIVGATLSTTVAFWLPRPSRIFPLIISCTITHFRHGKHSKRS